MYEIINLGPNSKLDDSRGRAIALGFFDGVHRGHQKLLQTIKGQTKQLIKVATTFRYLPVNDIGSNLTTLEERLALFTHFGIQQAIILDFKQIQSLSPLNYLKLLEKSLNCRVLACGLNHYFGNQKEGNVELLRSYPFIKTIVVDHVLSAKQEIISSSLIKNCISKADIRQANILMGHNFSLKSQVQDGAQIGRQIGFPTLNLPYPAHKLRPPLGVYAALATINSQKYFCALNYGQAPTIKNLQEPLMEVFLILKSQESLPDFKGVIHLELIDFIRPEEKFKDKAALVRQIQKDTQQIQNYLASLNLL